MSSADPPVPPPPSIPTDAADRPTIHRSSLSDPTLVPGFPDVTTTEDPFDTILLRLYGDDRIYPRAARATGKQCMDRIALYQAERGDTTLVVGPRLGSTTKDVFRHEPRGSWQEMSWVPPRQRREGDTEDWQERGFRDQHNRAIGYLHLWKGQAPGYKHGLVIYMDDEHIRVARWMRKVEPGEVDDNDGEEPFPLLDVDDFGNDGDGTDGSGSEARSDGGRLPGAIRGFGAVLDENGNPNGWFGPTGQFARGSKDEEQGAAAAETGEEASGVELCEDVGRMGHAARVCNSVLYDTESDSQLRPGRQPGNEMDAEFTEGRREEEDTKDIQLVEEEEMETKAPTSTMHSSTVVIAAQMKPSRKLQIEAYESTDEEDDRELVEGQDMDMKRPTVTCVEHVEERPESPLKRKRLE